MSTPKITWPDKVILCEVGLRDGLQNEKAIPSIEQKLQLLDAVVVYYLISFVLIVYCLARLFTAWRSGREGAGFILCGFALLGAIAAQRNGKPADTALSFGNYALFAMPAFSQTPAATGKRLVHMDGLYLLGFGPRTPMAARDLMAAIYPEAAIPPLKTAAAP